MKLIQECGGKEGFEEAKRRGDVWCEVGDVYKEPKSYITDDFYI